MTPWIRIGVLCLLGVSSFARSQPAGDAACPAAGVAARGDFFVLPMGGEQVGVPVSAASLRHAGARGFATVAVPTGLQAALTPAYETAGSELLRTRPSSSGSALVRADAALTVEHAEGKRHGVTLVMKDQPGGEPAPVAALVVDRSREPAARVSLFPLSATAASGAASAIDVEKYEFLYTLAFRQEPEASFCLASRAGRCDGGRPMAQEEVLRAIARQRQCALARLPKAVRAGFREWRVATVRPAAPHPGEGMRVSARLFDRAGPVAGALLSFSRAPHSGCTATTRVNGVATCELVDEHAHEGGHEEHESAPVVVTFPGDLARQPVLLPTVTLIHPPGGGAHGAHAASRGAATRAAGAHRMPGSERTAR